MALEDRARFGDRRSEVLSHSTWARPWIWKDSIRWEPRDDANPSRTATFAGSGNRATAWSLAWTLSGTGDEEPLHTTKRWEQILSSGPAWSRTAAELSSPMSRHGNSQRTQTVSELRLWWS